MASWTWPVFRQVSIVAQRPITVGILGAGVVGGGLYQLLKNNADQIRRSVGTDVVVTGLADIDWERPRDFSVPDELKTNDAMGLINSPDIDIIVETIGGTGAARDFIMAAIAAGKSVVTSNKELMAKHGEQILEAAAQQGVDVEFEGTVGGVIPIIRSLKESLTANRLDEIIGIVNGTTNYILTRMSQEGKEFGEVLAEAQALGYAEADPTDDIEGIDAANKLAILAAIAFGARAPVEQIYREGISGITPADLDYARRMNYVIKLLAIGKRDNDQIQLRVHPALLPADHPLAAVNGVFNAIFVRGPECGEVMLYGQGAGAMPTGSAVAADVVDCARNIIHHAAGRVPCTCEGQAQIKPMADIETRAYVRMRIADRPGVLGTIATIFGQEGISIQSVIQESSQDKVAEIVWIVHKGPEQYLQAALRCIKNMNIVEEICNMIRVVE